MARPVSWFPRLPALARSVSESARSHYTCSDLERLFEIQPRSAQMPMNPRLTVRIGKSLLAEREAAGDPACELTAIRVEDKPRVVRRRLRELVQRNVPAGVSPFPQRLSRARPLIIHSTTVKGGVKPGHYFGSGLRHLPSGGTRNRAIRRTYSVWQAVEIHRPSKLPLSAERNATKVYKAHVGVVTRPSNGTVLRVSSPPVDPLPTG